MRRLSSLTFEERLFIEMAAHDPAVAASGVTEGLLIDEIVSDRPMLTEAQRRALDAFLERFTLSAKAQRVFDEVMAEPSVLFMNRITKGGASTRRTDSPARSARAEELQKKEEDIGQDQPR